MTTFKSVATGVALAGAAALLPTLASAEGLPDRGGHSYRDAPPAGFTWSGGYVGLNAGYAWGDADSRSNFRCGNDAVCEQAGLPTSADTGVLAFVGRLGTGDVSGDGFTGGIQAGYNWQRGNVVFGIEADFNGLDIGGSQSQSGLVPGGAGQLAQVSTSLSADWLLTVRARLGVTVTPNVLLYATGGLAIAEVEVTNRFRDNLSEFGGAANNEGASRNSDVRTGWTVGGGLEWALDRNWSIKTEYLYVDLGSISTRAAVGNIDAFANTLDTSADLTAHIVRAGINYKF
jgi:outer membrane immunogenic protein